MAAALFSLAIVCVATFVGPFLSSLIPGNWIQAGAFILILGSLLGPHGAGLIDPAAPGLPLLRQLGLAFIFLMGGYNLEPSRVVGSTGRHAMLAWLSSFGLGLLVAWLLPLEFSAKALIAFAISLTSTAFSKVESILSARHELDTPMGKVTESYGATGELLPVVAVALLLEERSPLVELGIMAFFVVVALVGKRLVLHEEHAHSKLDVFVHKGADSNHMIVAGFAAGFILRQLTPDDSPVIGQVKIVAYGFFVPVAFVLSGCNVDVFEGGSEPLVVAGFILLLLLVRGLPVFVTLSLAPETRSMNPWRRFNIAIYSCTAMSTVVAMTSVAQEAGDMTAHIASVLVFAAALTTIVVPIITRLVEKTHSHAQLKSHA